MNRQSIAKYIWCAAILAMAFGLYWRLMHLPDTQVKFLLDFYKNAVELFFGNSHYFWEDGFYTDEGVWTLTGMAYWAGDNYNIGVNCLGLSIIPLLFGTCGIRGVVITNGWKRALWLPASAVAAVVVGVFANILRLFSSIYCVALAKFELVHAALGILIYLAAVMFCYVLVGNLFTPQSKEAVS